jgi:hypothetical protein
MIIGIHFLCFLGYGTLSCGWQFSQTFGKAFRFHIYFEPEGKGSVLMLITGNIVHGCNLLFGGKYTYLSKG